MAETPPFSSNLEGFERDDGNTTKNALGHGVSHAEAEEIFFMNRCSSREAPKRAEQFLVLPQAV